MRNTRLAGHGLCNEGAAYDEHGRVNEGTVGFALCACGAHSEVLESTAARKRWHVTHKAEIRRVVS